MLRLLALLALLLPASAQTAEWEWRLPLGIEPPPVPADNPMSAAKVELGRRLFYDVKLSGPGYIACASCHQPERAFSEARPVAIGGTGERHTLNSMALVNIAYLPALTWADPNQARLEGQALVPLFGQHPKEMDATGQEATILDRFRHDPTYLRLFAEAFPELGGRLDFAAVPKALAAFQRTLLSFDSPFDRYRRGDRAALSDSAVRGAALFFDGRLGCGECHPAPHFTNAVPQAAYHNIGQYNDDGDGAGPGHPGLARHTGRAADRGRFRTPTLRNIALTAPYMHDGAVATLSEVIDDYAAGGRSARQGRRSPLTDPLIRPFALTAAEKADLLAFLDS
ncbi:MAG TPA: MbnH family di-heme enzyme, partial [Alphaproteobacteria bacterium]|nr:MbnH family di-heme enzyme [Alphaproteobacteria bacterium]